MILSGEMTLCRVRQKTKKQLAQKTLAGIRKDMARPREARSAQKKCGAAAATNSIPRREFELIYRWQRVPLPAWPGCESDR
jgi:hypothetical protein